MSVIMGNSSGALLCLATVSLTALVLLQRDGVYAILAVAALLSTFMMRYRMKQADACGESLEHGVSASSQAVDTEAKEVAAKKAMIRDLRADAAVFFPGSEPKVKRTFGQYGYPESASPINPAWTKTSFLNKERPQNYVSTMEKKKAEFQKRYGQPQFQGPMAMSQAQAGRDALAASMTSYQALLTSGARTVPAAPSDDTKVQELLHKLHERDLADYDARLRGTADTDGGCRRLVAGSRETIRAIHRGRALAIVIASDIGSDSKVKWMVKEAQERSVPVLLGPSKRDLGNTVAGYIQMTASFVTILHASGEEALFADAVTTRFDANRLLMGQQ